MQYVVIFKAQIKELDQRYFEIVQQIRNKALSQFHCQHFQALTEGSQEVALSYCNSLHDIQAWHADAEHQAAQELGKNSWLHILVWKSVKSCGAMMRSQVKSLSGLTYIFPHLFSDILVLKLLGRKISAYSFNV